MRERSSSTFSSVSVYIRPASARLLLLLFLINSSCRHYEVSLVRKNNDLNVGTVVYNERLAYLLRNTTLNVELDAEGNLVVVGDRVDQLTAALGDGNVINTMLLSKDSDRLRAVEGESGAQDRSGRERCRCPGSGR